MRLQKNSIAIREKYVPTNRLTIHILAAVAEHERAMISERTKSALAAAKARGKKLGSPQNMSLEAQAKGAKAGMLANKFKADSFALEIQEIIKHYQCEGLNLSQIADRMNAAHILTARGKTCNWRAQSVKNVLRRAI